MKSDNSMKTRVIVSILAIFFTSTMFAQNVGQVFDQSEANEEREVQIDSTFFGINIFSLVGHSGKDEGSVKINQSSDVVNGMSRYIARNENKQMSGWRVRIYFDNNQNARTQSEAIAREFSAAYPRIQVYRNHVSPYFKVTVGNFRTKYEAQQFANQIKNQYPSVFLVKENMKYPSL